MKTLIIIMQKGLKPVIKQIISIGWVLFSINCSLAQQNNNDDYDIAYLVMQNTHDINDSVYTLINYKTIINHYHLKRYYNFRVNNRPFYTRIIIDSIIDDVVIDSIQLERDMTHWKKKYRILDSLFTAEEIRTISNFDSIPLNVKKEKWDSTLPIFNTDQLQVKWSRKYPRNFISKPFYNKQKNIALVVYVKKDKPKISYPTYYIFRKEDNTWKFIDKIENFGF